MKRKYKIWRNWIGAALIVFLAANVIMNKIKEKPQQTVVPTYKVLELQKGSGTMTMSFPSTIQSAQVVEIRPRVEGYLEAKYVTEGARVTKGQPLFKINDEVYQQQLEGAKADVMAAQANLDNKQLDVKKVTPLVEKNIVSPFQLETAISDVEAAQAKLQQARSQMEQARINIGYTVITSPVDGRVSQITLREGSLVKVSDAKPMTTVSAFGEMFAYFSISEKLVVQGLTSDGKVKRAFPKANLQLADGTVYTQPGTVELASGIVDSQTGSLLVKAIFPNPDGVLTTGLSGVVLIPQEYQNVITIPQSATFELLDKKMVYVVGEDDIIHSREITLEGNDGSNYIVRSGLSAGDKILIEGINKVKEGFKIVPEVVKTAPAPADSVSVTLN